MLLRQIILKISLSRLSRKFSLSWLSLLLSSLMLVSRKGYSYIFGKTASIIPVPKVKNPASANELRPLPWRKSWGECLIYFWQEWLRDNFTPSLDIKKYGIVKGTSTTYYLVDMIYNVSSGIEKSFNYATLVAIDFTKAFDRINHTVAVRTIVSSEVKPSIVSTIWSFSSDRT